MSEFDDLGPFTLEEAKEWLHWLEDIATINRDRQYADRVLLINLVLELAAAGVVDGKALVSRMSNSIPQIEGENYKAAVQVLIDEIRGQLPVPKPPGIVH
jgi:hypothetical protein